MSLLGVVFLGGFIAFFCSNFLGICSIFLGIFPLFIFAGIPWELPNCNTERTIFFLEENGNGGTDSMGIVFAAFGK